MSLNRTETEAKLLKINDELCACAFLITIPDDRDGIWRVDHDRVTGFGNTLLEALDNLAKRIFESPP